MALFSSLFLLTNCFPVVHEYFQHHNSNRKKYFFKNNTNTPGKAFTLVQRLKVAKEQGDEGKNNTKICSSGTDSEFVYFSSCFYISVGVLFTQFLFDFYVTRMKWTFDWRIFVGVSLNFWWMNARKHVHQLKMHTAWATQLSLALFFREQNRFRSVCFICLAFACLCVCVCYWLSLSLSPARLLTHLLL